MEAYPNFRHDSLHIIIRDKEQDQGETYPVTSSVTGHPVAPQSAFGMHLGDNAETNVTTTVGQWPSNSYENSETSCVENTNEETCCHGQRKLADGESCCHEQKKLPESSNSLPDWMTGTRQSCCHEQRKLPGPMFEARQSCCLEQRKLPDRQSCCHEQDLPSSENLDTGLSASLVTSPALEIDQNDNQRSDSSVAVSLYLSPVSASGVENDELPFHQQEIEPSLSVESGVVSPSVLDDLESETVQHDEQGYDQPEGAVGQGIEVPEVEVKRDVDMKRNLTIAEGEEILYKTFHTAMSQSEPSRPARSAAKPSRYRDEHFETQFRPGTKTKVRQVHFDPGKEEQWQVLGKEETQKGVRKNDSSWTGQTRSSLVGQTECSSPQNRSSLRLKIGPKFGRPIWPKPRLKCAKLNRHPVRFKFHTPNHKLSQETSRFRVFSRSSLTRFRPWCRPNTQMSKKQQPSLRVQRAKWPYKLSRGTFRVGMLNRCCSIRFRPYAPCATQSGNVEYATNPAQVTSLHHSSSGSVEKGLQKNARNQAKMLRHCHGLTAIPKTLSGALHSTGAQNQCQAQARRIGEESHAESPINGGPQRPITVAPAASKGVKWTPQVAGDQRSLTRRRVEVIKRRGAHQTTGHRASWASQYNGVQPLLLYAHWQANRPQLSPIIEQEECSHNLPSILPLNSSESLSSCLLESPDKKARKSRKFGYAELPCILPQSVRQSACNTALCTEHDVHHDRHQYICQLPIHGPSVVKEIGYTAFPESPRKSSIAVRQHFITNFHQDPPKGSCPVLPKNWQKHRRKPKYNCIQRQKKYGYKSFHFSNNNQQSLRTSNGTAKSRDQDNGKMSNYSDITSTHVPVPAPVLSTSADTVTSARSVRPLAALMSILQPAPKYPPDMGLRMETSNAMFNVILLQNVDVNTLCRDTGICNSESLLDTSMYGNKSTFERHEHSHWKDLPRVHMARTKQSARRERDDKKRDQDDRRRSDERRRDQPKPKAKQRREQSPRPDQYTCVFCQKVNKQRTNHKRHLVMSHRCRLDGTPATEADIAQAKAWNSKTPADRTGQYKSKEYVSSSDSDSDDDDSPGSSSSSKHSSPSPPRRQRRTERDSSESPPRRRRDSSSPPPKIRKVRFELDEPVSQHGEPSQRQKKPTKSKSSTTKSATKVQPLMDLVVAPPTTPLKKTTTTAAKRSKKAVPTVKSEVHATAKPQEPKQKATTASEQPVCSTSTMPRKELIIQSPRLDDMVKVAKKAVENLKNRKEVKVHEPSPYRPTFGPTPKQSRQAQVKGQSVITNKGKASVSATASAKTQSVVTPGTSAQPLPETATPVTALSLEEQQNQANQAKVDDLGDIPQLRIDLELSSDSSDNTGLAKVLATGQTSHKDDTLRPDSDVEPDSEPEPHPAPQGPSTTPEPAIPEVLADFKETITISDAESTTDPAPTTSGTPVPTAVALMPPVPLTDAFVPLRKPTRPSKPPTPIQKLKATAPPIEAVPRTPEAVQQAKRRTKAVSSLHLAQASLNYQRSTDEISTDFADSYQLTGKERYQVRREMRKMRLGLKTWTLKMRSRFPIGDQSEEGRKKFLGYFEREAKKICDRASDSDDALDLTTGADEP